MEEVMLEERHQKQLNRLLNIGNTDPWEFMVQERIIPAEFNEHLGELLPPEQKRVVDEFITKYSLSVSLKSFDLYKSDQRIKPQDHYAAFWHSPVYPRSYFEKYE